MKNLKYVHMFTDADTCLTFKSKEKALEYCKSRRVSVRPMLIVHESRRGLSYSVYNPWLHGNIDTEYFNTESEALEYIGSFGFSSLDLCIYLSLGCYIPLILLYIFAIFRGG